MVWFQLEREISERITGYRREAALRACIPRSGLREPVAALLRNLADTIEGDAAQGDAIQDQAAQADTAGRAEPTSDRPVTRNGPATALNGRNS